MRKSLGAETVDLLLEVLSSSALMHKLLMVLLQKLCFFLFYLYPYSFFSLLWLKKMNVCFCRESSKGIGIGSLEVCTKYLLRCVIQLIFCSAFTIFWYVKFLFLNLFLLDAKSHPRVLLTHIPLYRPDQTPCGPHRASSVIDQVIYLCLESSVVQTQNTLFCGLMYSLSCYSGFGAIFKIKK